MGINICHIQYGVGLGMNERKRRTMQEFGMENEVNLCTSCCFEYPACDPQNIVYGTGFGTGVGDDNIAACDIYEAITLRNHR